MSFKKNLLALGFLSIASLASAFELSNLEKKVISYNGVIAKGGSVMQNISFEDYLDKYIGNEKVAVPSEQLDENGKIITYYDIGPLKLKDDSAIYKPLKKEYDKIIPEFLKSAKSELELKIPKSFEFDPIEYIENLKKVYNLKENAITIKCLEDSVILKKPKSSC